MLKLQCLRVQILERENYTLTRSCSTFALTESCAADYGPPHPSGNHKYTSEQRGQCSAHFNFWFKVLSKIDYRRHVLTCWGSSSPRGKPLGLPPYPLRLYTTAFPHYLPHQVWRLNDIRGLRCQITAPCGEFALFKIKAPHTVRRSMVFLLPTTIFHTLRALNGTPVSWHIPRK